MKVYLSLLSILLAAGLAHASESNKPSDTQLKMQEKPIVVAQNDSKCLDNCENTRSACYKASKSTIKCENDCDKCVLKCK